MLPIKGITFRMTTRRIYFVGQGSQFAGRSDKQSPVTIAPADWKIPVENRRGQFHSTGRILCVKPSTFNFQRSTGGRLPLHQSTNPSIHLLLFDLRNLFTRTGFRIKEAVIEGRPPTLT